MNPVLCGTNKVARLYGVDHTSTYPPDLAAACLALTTRSGDWVCDPFGGSGSTALGALKVGLNRRPPTRGAAHRFSPEMAQ